MNQTVSADALNKGFSVKKALLFYLAAALLFGVLNFGAAVLDFAIVGATEDRSFSQDYTFADYEDYEGFAAYLVYANSGKVPDSFTKSQYTKYKSGKYLTEKKYLQYIESSAVIPQSEYQKLLDAQAITQAHYDQVQAFMASGEEFISTADYTSLYKTLSKNGEITEERYLEIQNKISKDTFVAMSVYDAQFAEGTLPEAEYVQIAALAQSFTSKGLFDKVEDMIATQFLNSCGYTVEHAIKNEVREEKDQELSSELPNMLYPQTIQVFLRLIVAVAIIIFMKKTSFDYQVGFSLTPSSKKSLAWMIPLIVVSVAYGLVKLFWVNQFMWTVLYLFSVALSNAVLLAGGVYLMRVANAGKIQKIFLPMLGVPLSCLVFYGLSFIPNFSGYSMIHLLQASNYFTMPIELVLTVLLSFFGVLVYLRTHQLFAVVLSSFLTTTVYCAVKASVLYFAPNATVISHILFLACVPLCLIFAVIALVDLLRKKTIPGDVLADYVPLDTINLFR